MTISPKKAVLITLAGLIIGVAMLAIVLPADQSEQKDQKLMFWFVLCFYGPLCFAINFPAMALYFMINKSQSVYFSIFAIILPAAALIYSLFSDYNNFTKLLPSLIIFGPVIFLILKLQKQAWKQKN